MSAHTPGPWRTKTGPGWHDTYIIGELVGAHEPTIATVPSVHVDHESYLANARLIAASPEMLAELRVTTNILRRIDDADGLSLADQEAMISAEVVIAKATGGQS